MDTTGVGVQTPPRPESAEILDKALHSWREGRALIVLCSGDCVLRQVSSIAHRFTLSESVGFAIKPEIMLDHTHAA